MSLPHRTIQSPTLLHSKNLNLIAVCFVLCFSVPVFIYSFCISMSSLFSLLSIFGNEALPIIITDAKTPQGDAIEFYTWSLPYLFFDNDRYNSTRRMKSESKALKMFGLAYSGSLVKKIAWRMLD